MSHLLYLMFRYDGDVMENLDFGVVFEGSKHTQGQFLCSSAVAGSVPSAVYAPGIFHGSTRKRYCRQSEQALGCFFSWTDFISILFFFSLA